MTLMLNLKKAAMTFIVATSVFTSIPAFAAGVIEQVEDAMGRLSQCDRQLAVALMDADLLKGKSEIKLFLQDIATSSEVSTVAKKLEQRHNGAEREFLVFLKDEGFFIGRDNRKDLLSLAMAYVRRFAPCGVITQVQPTSIPSPAPTQDPGNNSVVPPVDHNPRAQAHLTPAAFVITMGGNANAYPQAGIPLDVPSNMFTGGFGSLGMQGWLDGAISILLSGNLNVSRPAETAFGADVAAYILLFRNDSNELLLGGIAETRYMGAYSSDKVNLDAVQTVAGGGAIRYTHAVRPDLKVGLEPSILFYNGAARVAGNLFVRWDMPVLFKNMEVFLGYKHTMGLTSGVATNQELEGGMKMYF